MGCGASRQLIVEKDKIIAERDATIETLQGRVTQLSKTLAQYKSLDKDPVKFECKHVSGQALAQICMSACAPCMELLDKVRSEGGIPTENVSIKLIRGDQELDVTKLLVEQGIQPGTEVPITVVLTECNGLAYLAAGPNRNASGNGRVQVCVDQNTDGGGWVLFWAYAHTGGTNPNLVPRTMPKDPEHGFSHATFADIQPALGFKLSSGDVQDVRFYARTSGHNRVIHFKTASGGVAQMVAGDAGDAAGFNTCAGCGAAGWWNSGWTPLEGHTAYLPQSGNGWWGSFSHFFVYQAGVRTWAIKGSGYRWEVDDHVAHRECAGAEANRDGYDGTSRTTLHQIWVRFKEGAVNITS